MKKLLSVILAITVICSAATAFAETSATSVQPSDWAQSSVETGKKLNFVDEGKNYNFPGEINRGEFCEFIFSYLKNVAGVSAATDGKNPFSDTDNAHIYGLNALGIINGKSETEFAPNDFLTREEAATIVHRMINKIYPNAYATQIYFEFADGDTISEWAMSAVQTLCNMGIMKGVEDNNFAPQEPYTTEQAIATLVRVHDSFGKTVKNADDGLLVDEKFTVYSLPWGRQWDELKNEEILSDAVVVRDDENTFAVKLSGAEFLGVKGDMVLTFSPSGDSYPANGLVKAYFSYDKNDKEIILANGEKIYGERKDYFLDKNGIENPLNPPAWYSEENLEEDMSPEEDRKSVV